MLLKGLVPLTLFGRRRAGSMATNHIHQFYPVSSFSASSEKAGSGMSTLRRRVISIVLFSITGGFTLSAVNDFTIFYGCSKMAVEKASENKKIIQALGTPIVRGPWYDASLAVDRMRNRVSCTFPVSGPHGSCTFHLKAVHNKEDEWFSFLRSHDWDIIILEAFIEIPSDHEDQHSLRISLTDIITPPNALSNCKACISPETGGARN